MSGALVGIIAVLVVVGLVALGFLLFVTYLKWGGGH